MTPARPRSPSPTSPLRYAFWLAGAVLAQACLSKEPSREVPPPAVPEQQAPTAPESEQEPAPAPTMAPPAAAPSREERVESGAASPAEDAPKSAGDESSAPRKRSAPARAKSTRPGTSGGGLGAPEALMQRLDREVSLSTPDCPSARDRKKAICDLASQICRLVERDPNAVSAERYCDEAKQRCSDAEERTSLRCSE